MGTTVDQRTHELAIPVGAAISKLLFKGIAQGFDIAVLAEHKRNDEPIIARANLPIFAVISIEGAPTPAFRIGWGP